MGIRRLVKDVLTGYQDKRYDRALAARKMTYSQWIEEKEKLWRAEERSKTEEERSRAEERSNAQEERDRAEERSDAEEKKKTARRKKMAAYRK